MDSEFAAISGAAVTGGSGAAISTLSTCCSTGVGGRGISEGVVSSGELGDTGSSFTTTPGSVSGCGTTGGGCDGYRGHLLRVVPDRIFQCRFAQDTELIKPGTGHNAPAGFIGNFENQTGNNEIPVLINRGNLIVEVLGALRFGHLHHLLRALAEFRHHHAQRCGTGAVDRAHHLKGV